jgi:nitrite reductase/ring-hydroxylating ferredoxin subunit
MHADSSTPADNPHDHPSRRGVLGGLIGVVSLAAVAAAYGAFAAVFGRFLHRGAMPRRWAFIARAEEIVAGQALTFRTPGGVPLNVTRQGTGDDSLLALSSTCPHLGCQVRWEPHNNRFFCPCHNGIFDPSGLAISGPPADAGQSLISYPLKVDRGMVFVEIPAQELSDTQVSDLPGSRDCGCSSDTSTIGMSTSGTSTIGTSPSTSRGPAAAMRRSNRA